MIGGCLPWVSRSGGGNPASVLGRPSPSAKHAKGRWSFCRSNGKATSMFPKVPGSPFGLGHTLKSAKCCPFTVSPNGPAENEGSIRSPLPIRHGPGAKAHTFRRRRRSHRHVGRLSRLPKHGTPFFRVKQEPNRNTAIWLL